MSDSKLSGSASAELERERERERGKEREREREQLINGITNERTNIGKDKRKDENYTPLGINAGEFRM